MLRFVASLVVEFGSSIFQSLMALVMIVGGVAIVAWMGSNVVICIGLLIAFEGFAIYFTFWVSRMLAKLGSPDDPPQE